MNPPWFALHERGTLKLSDGLLPTNFMPEIIVKDPQKKLPLKWRRALQSLSEQTGANPQDRYGFIVWPSALTAADFTDEDLQREWVILFLKKMEGMSWPSFVPRVVATHEAPWSEEWLKKFAATRAFQHEVSSRSQLNSHLVREQERLLHELKNQLVEKTETRRKELEESQQKLRRTQQRLIRLNALISSLSQANSEAELNDLLTEQIPRLLSPSSPLSTEDENMLDQIREVTSLVFHHKAQLQHARELTEEWTKTFDSLEDPIALVNNQLESIRTNKAFESHKLHSCFAAEIKDLVKKSLEGATSASKEFQVSGQDRWYYVQCMPVLAKHRQQPSLCVLYYRDITASRNIRKHILQAEKLTELGVLAGSVAHEINNPLAGILAFIQLAKSSLGSEHTAMSDVKEMERAALQCKAIVQNLLSFSRKANLEESGLISIHQILETIAPLIQLQLKHENVLAHFHWNRDCKSFFVHGSFNHFMQILINVSTLCLEDAKALQSKVEFHWSTNLYRDGFYAIEITYSADPSTSLGTSHGTEKELLQMCHYVTLELLKQNNGTLETIARKHTRGWRVILPAANGQKLRTAQYENSDPL